jgi:hypothetical protein
MGINQREAEVCILVASHIGDSIQGLFRKGSRELECLVGDFLAGYQGLINHRFHS